MPHQVTHRSVLGTKIACVNYATALAVCERLARSGRPAAVSACNTHIVSQARHSPNFRRVMDRFDVVLPDGMPLIWALNAQGARLEDRVYGPYFMRHALCHATPGTRHFFFGGTEDTLRRLVWKARTLNPEMVIAGTCSPPFRKWTEGDEAEFARMIRESRADFIWVALGGERQEAWIVDQLHRHERGVFFAVGDAFALLAGERPFAPAWMQALSLTWLYRLWQEPRRLGRRYLRYNSLFLYYLAKDFLAGRWPHAHQKPAAEGGRRGLRIAFVGSRGVPARYSGFETVVEELGSRLAERGHEVTVYNRLPHYREILHEWKGMRLRWFPTLPTKNLESIVHTSISLVDVLFRDFDLLYVCGVGNTPWSAAFKKALGCRVVVNVDGADFKRKKWGPLARWWLRVSEQRATRVADAVIADNRTVVDRYRRVYGFDPEYLTYGAPIRQDPVRCGTLERWNLKEGGYVLHVSRLTPENETDLLLRAHARMGRPIPLVVVGAAGYEQAYERRLRALAGEQVVFTGGVYGDAYVELSQRSAFFVMPATIEATRLVLLDQMGMGKAVLFHDCPASREVLGDAGEAFGGGGLEDPVDALTERMQWLCDHPEHAATLGRRALERAQSVYSWDRMVDRYEELFGKILDPDGKRP